MRSVRAPEQEWLLHLRDRMLDAFCGYDLTGIADLADKVRRAWDGAEMKTMLQLNERELVVTAEQAGFERIDAPLN